MELILKETIDNLGREGDVVTVKPGYGRNYLLPQGKAVVANKENIQIVERNKAAIEARVEQERIAAEKMSKKLSGIVIELEQLAGEDERLFGSVNAGDIRAKLAEKDLDLDKKQILLTEPIKTLGETQVPIKVGFQMKTEITVKVTALEKSEK